MFLKIPNVKYQIIIVLIVIAPVLSQPTTLWTHTYEQFGTGVGEFVRETTDGGFIIVGTSVVNYSPRHFLVKTNSDGKIIWHKTFKEYNHHWSSSVEPTSDGGYIFGGGATDAWLIKFDAKGKEIWQKSFGGDGYQFGRYAQPTKDGGYILVGAYSQKPIEDNPRCKLWLIKTDSLGNMSWDKMYGSDEGNMGICVQQTKDNGYIVAGYSDSKFYLLKVNSSGKIEWEKAFKGNYDESNRITWVEQTRDGGYVFVGRSSSGLEKSDIHLFKTDPSGNMQWHKVFDKKYDHAKFVQQTRDGGYIIAGNTCSSWRSEDHDVWIIKTDPKGEIVWERIMDGDYWDTSHCIRQTVDGGYVFTGSYGKSSGLSGRQLCLVRFEPEIPEIETRAEPKRTPNPP